MEAMLEISLYSFPYLRYQKRFIVLIIAYVFSSTNWKKRAEKVLPGREEGGREERECRGQGGEMTQTMYAHMNI
jgi:hypothetical protein